MIAMLVLALTIGLALNAASTGRRLALRASEVRQANLLTEQLLSRLQAVDQVEEGRTGGLAWRLETRQPGGAVVDPEAPRLCRREVAIRAVSGAVYRDGVSLLCDEATHVAPLAMVGLLQGTQMIARVQRANAADHQTLAEARALQATLMAVFRAPGADSGALGEQLRGDASHLDIA
eukprot:gene16503-16319_t